jgi:molybdopterin-guanine dinucleotide biosynthesis protein A
MGKDKSLIPLAGAPLIQRALEILREAGVAPRIAGARSDFTSFAPAVQDDPSNQGQGPLSGICSGLAASSARYAVFLPVDLPLLPSSLIAFLLHHAQVTESTVTVASVAGFVQTFPAIIDRAAAPTLKARLRSCDRKCLTAFQQAAEVLAKPFSVLPVELLLQAGQIQHPMGLPPGQWFHNINTPNDLSRAEAILARHPVPIFK